MIRTFAKKKPKKFFSVFYDLTFLLGQKLLGLGFCPESPNNTKTAISGHIGLNSNLNLHLNFNFNLHAK